jgi:hypothetical protein
VAVKGSRLTDEVKLLRGSEGFSKRGGCGNRTIIILCTESQQILENGYSGENSKTGIHE